MYESYVFYTCIMSSKEIIHLHEEETRDIRCEKRKRG